MAKLPRPKKPRPKAAKSPRVRGKSDGHRFPSKEEVIRYIEDSPTPIGKREIARAFRIPTAERPALRALIKELRAEGIMGRRGPGACLGLAAGGFGAGEDLLRGNEKVDVVEVVALGRIHNRVGLSVVVLLIRFARRQIRIHSTA